MVFNVTTAIFQPFARRPRLIILTIHICLNVCGWFHDLLALAQPLSSYKVLGHWSTMRQMRHVTPLGHIILIHRVQRHVLGSPRASGIGEFSSVSTLAPAGFEKTFKEMLGTCGSFIWLLFLLLIRSSKAHLEAHKIWIPVWKNKRVMHTTRHIIPSPVVCTNGVHYSYLHRERLVIAIERDTVGKVALFMWP